MAKRDVIDALRILRELVGIASQGVGIYNSIEDKKEDKRRRQEDVTFRNMIAKRDESQFNQRIAIDKKQQEQNAETADFNKKVTVANMRSKYTPRKQAETLYPGLQYQKASEIEAGLGVDIFANDEEEYISNDFINDLLKKKEFEGNQALRGAQIEVARLNSDLLRRQRELTNTALEDNLVKQQTSRGVATAIPQIMSDNVNTWADAQKYLSKPQGTSTLNITGGAVGYGGMPVLNYTGSAGPTKGDWNKQKVSNTKGINNYMQTVVNPLLEGREALSKAGLPTEEVDVLLGSRIFPNLQGMKGAFDEGYAYGNDGNTRVKADVWNALKRIQALNIIRDTATKNALTNMMMEQEAKATGRTMGNAWGREK